VGIGDRAAHPPGRLPSRLEKPSSERRHHELLTQSLRDQLLRNGQLRVAADEQGDSDPDFLPVVKLFTPDAGCTWLLSELDLEDPGHRLRTLRSRDGCPKLGCVRISELESVRGKLGLPIERDLHFAPKHTISVYARAAWNASTITESADALRQADSAIDRSEGVMSTNIDVDHRRAFEALTSGDYGNFALF